MRKPETAEEVNEYFASIEPVRAEYRTCCDCNKRVKEYVQTSWYYVCRPCNEVRNREYYAKQAALRAARSGK
jgi:hypothetical protein